MARDAECREEDVAALLALRRRLIQRGWFN
jgi:hypothetical protein